MLDQLFALFAAFFALSLEVAFFWRSKLLSTYKKKRPKQELLDQLASAQTYEQWEEVALRLDVLLGNDLWRQNPVSKDYDYRLINERLQGLMEAREEGDMGVLVNLLRSGLLRNLGNMCGKNLFNRSYAGSKLLIENYLLEVLRSLNTIAAQPSSPSFSAQTKLDILHDTRQAFGRSTLVLQGGAIFGLYHLGVVKALHRHALLPRIITGTAVGALIAALVCIHTDDELPIFLRGEGIDLSAFVGREKGGVRRKIRRWWTEGHLLDMKVIEQCVQSNLGNITFEEAYNLTKRILNITVSTTGRNEVPTLLNYITAPNVLIWTAACASNASVGLFQNVALLCKDENGNNVPWAALNQEITWTREDNNSYERIAELFNVNHFIVSQARPYVAPFLMSDIHRHRSPSLTLKMLRLLGLEARHRLHQLDKVGLLPKSIRRFVVDEIIQGASVTVVPDLEWKDWERVLGVPNKEVVDYWVLKGERSIWPVIGLIGARCRVELGIDGLYQMVRSMKPVETIELEDTPETELAEGMRRRSFSVGGKKSTMSKRR